MGAFFSCPLAKHIGVKNGVESQSITVKSFSFGDDEVKPPERSISFNSGDLEPTIMKSVGSGRTALESSVSFKGKDLEKITSMEATDIPLREEELHVVANSPKSKDVENQSPRAESYDGIQMTMDLGSTNREHMAATELQKVYKSFRTRRRLADCAVLAEKSWWKLLNFAELKRSSISFFDIEKHKTAISRWSRARTRAARVGKGLSKNEKAQMLALQHWLEAVMSIDRSTTSIWPEPTALLRQMASLSERTTLFLLLERTAYEVVVEDGKFIYKQSGELVHTTRVNKHEKWIFVLSTSKTLYVGKKMKGTFHHSSFLAGGATLAAGSLVVENGILQAVWPHSGHYRPTEENFQEFISFLTENNVDLTDVKMNPDDEEDNVLQMQKSSSHVRFKSSEEDWVQQLSAGLDDETVEIVAEEMTSEKHHNQDRSNLIEKLDMDNQEMRSETFVSESDTKASKKNSEEENRSCEVEFIPDESILKRINSHKETKSYQLGKQLSCKWTTGAGPRIGCVRDYPVELQLRALEQVCL